MIYLLIIVLVMGAGCGILGLTYLFEHTRFFRKIFRWLMRQIMF